MLRLVTFVGTLALLGCGATQLPNTGGTGGNATGDADLGTAPSTSGPDLGVVGSACTSLCDCQPGLVCTMKQCQKSNLPVQIYCCESKDCPSGSFCETRNGGFQQCGGGGGGFGGGGNGGFGGGGNGGFGGGGPAATAAEAVVAEAVVAATGSLRAPAEASPVYEVVAPMAATAFAGLPAKVREVLRLCDGVRTLESICVCSPLPAEQTRRVIDRLVELGNVTVKPPPPPRRRRLTPEGSLWARLGPPDDEAATRMGADATGFSDDEEQFFSRSIDHLVGDDFYQ